MPRNVLDFVALRLFGAGTRRSPRLARKAWRELPGTTRTFYRRLARETLVLIGRFDPIKPLNQYGRPLR